MALPNSYASLEFRVHRREPELITPAKPTPHEFKPLSDIDDQEILRFHIPVIQVYRNGPSMRGKDPVNVIREAIAKTLVFYYPFAGRLRELGPSRKLIVECTGEGILFIEADANFTIDQCGNALLPPCSCLEEILFDVPGSSGVLNCPLLLIQVTRFKCGGFTFAVRLNHTMADAPGLGQFMLAIGEMAHGKQARSVFPVWERQVLAARNPPQITCIHREYDEVPDTKENIPFPLDNTVDRAFFIKFSQVDALRRLISPHLRNCTSFEILSAYLWKCRTIALRPDPNQEMRFIAINNARRKLDPPLLPNGYYGNGFVLSTAVATAKQLSQNSIDYAIELTRKAKNDMCREYFQSVADLMAIKGRPNLYADGTYIVSDVRHAGLQEVDFGWGKAIFGGVARAIPILASFYAMYESKKGENEIVFPICLPAQAMERFEKELKSLFQDLTVNYAARSSFIMSSL